MSSDLTGIRPVIAADGGYENRVEVVPGAGGLLVRKTFRRRDRFVAEVSAIRILQESGRVPRLREVCDERLVLVREWVPGSAIELSGVPPSVVAHRIGCIAACLKDVHAHTAPCWGPLEQPEAGWEDYLHRRLRTRLLQAEPALADARRLRQWALGRIRDLRVPEAPALLHHDVKPANMVLSLDRVVLVDLEQAKGGDPLSDLAKLKWRAFGCDDRQWRVFAKAYAGLAFDEISERTVDFYLAMHCLGAIAYGVCFGTAAYAQHVASARRILERLLARA